MPKFSYLNCRNHIFKYPQSCEFVHEFIRNVVYCTAAIKCGILRKNRVTYKRKKKRDKFNEYNKHDAN